MAKKKTIAISVDMELYEEIKKHVDFKKTSVNAWGKNLILDFFKKKNIIKPIEQIELPKDPYEELRDAPRIDTHSCLHMKQHYIPPYNASMCVGTCANERNLGRPCNHTSATAPNCDFFRAWRR